MILSLAWLPLADFPTHLALGWPALAGMPAAISLAWLTGHLRGLIVFLLAALGIAIANAISLRRPKHVPRGGVPRVDVPHATSRRTDAASDNVALENVAPSNVTLENMVRDNVALKNVARKVSILVPARNEEANIERCVRSLLAQEYSNFELLVMDDHSTDQTGAILARLAEEDSRLRLADAEPLPAGWLGKHWTCHQLAAQAAGELLLFTDADTRHAPAALSEAVRILNQKNLGLLSFWPRQEVVTWGERLVVPVIYWAMLSFVPTFVGDFLRLPFLASAIGQYLLVTRHGYTLSGGFAAIRTHPADDIALARRVRRAGLTTHLYNGANLVTCRMYRSTQQAIEGLSKNLLAVFDHRLLPYGFVWLFLGLAFLSPWMWLALAGLGLSLPDGAALLAAAAAACGLLVWAVTLLHFRFPAWLVCLSPIISALAVYLAFRSLWLGLRGRAAWKGRALPRSPIRPW